MAKFVNTNMHRVYVRDAKDDKATRLLPGETIEATGAFADSLLLVPGILDASSDQGKVKSAQIAQTQQNAVALGIVPKEEGEPSGAGQTGKSKAVTTASIPKSGGGSKPKAKPKKKAEASE